MLRRTTLIIVGVIGIVGLILVDARFRREQEVESHHEMDQYKQTLYERLTQDLEERIAVIEDIKGLLYLQGTLDPGPNFTKFLSTLLENHPDIDSVILLDADQKTLYAHSLTTEEVEGLQARFSQYAPFIEDAVTGRQTVVTDPLENKDQNFHIMTWVPIYKGDQFKGMIGGLFEISTVLRDLNVSVDQELRISFRDRHGRMFWGEGASTRESSAVIPVGDNHWIMSVSWAEQVPELDSNIVILIWGVGGALLLSILFIINRTWTRQETLARVVYEKTNELKKINDQLIKEIDERITSEQALQESEERFRATFDQANVGIAQVSLDGSYMKVNNKLCEITGYPPDQLTAMSFQQITHEDDLQADLEILDQLLRGEISSFSMDKRIYRKNGETAWVSLGVSLVRDSEAQPKYFVCVTEDITATIKAEEEAKHRQDELTHASRLATLGEMATGLAHEINQPLSAIVNYSKGCLLRMQGGRLSEEETRKIMECISGQAERAAEIMKRLRNFVRKTSPMKKPVHLGGVLEDVRQFVHPEARNRNTEMKIAIDPDLPKVYADPIQIGQVLLNLVRNALDAMNEAGLSRKELTIRAYRLGQSFVEMGVKDSGMGIHPDKMDLIFDPFFSTKKNGTGLGLSISRSLIEAHDGKLWVELNADGQGVEFFFTLPVFQE